MGFPVHVTVCPINLIAADKPLPTSIREFASETRILVDATRHLTGIIKFADKYYPDGLPVPPGAPFAHYVVHCLGVESLRLQKCLPKVERLLPRYPNIPKIADTVGESYHGITIQMGTVRWNWLHQCIRSENALPPQDHVSDWEYARRVADRVAPNLSHARKFWQFTEPDFDETFGYLHAEIARTTPANDADGPFGMDGFRWQGREYHGMRKLVHRLIAYLWGEPDKTADFDELGVPVWDDHAVVPDSGTVGSVRRDANQFFESNRIPFRVRIRSQRVTLTTG